jgi:hypothetical protein
MTRPTPLLSAADILIVVIRVAPTISLGPRETPQLLRPQRHVDMRRPSGNHDRLRRADATASPTLFGTQRITRCQRP